MYRKQKAKTPPRPVLRDVNKFTIGTVIDDLTLVEPTSIQTSATNSRKGWYCRCRCGELVRKTNKQLAVLQFGRCGVACVLHKRTEYHRKLYVRLWVIRDRLKRHEIPTPDPVCKPEAVIKAIGDAPDENSVLLLKDPTKADTIDNLYWESDPAKIALLHQANAKFLDTPWGKLSRAEFANRLGVSPTYVQNRLREKLTATEIITRAARHTGLVKNQQWKLEGTTIGYLTVLKKNYEGVNASGFSIFYGVRCQCGNQFVASADTIMSSLNYDCTRCRKKVSPDCVGKLPQRVKELRNAFRTVAEEEHVPEWNNRLKFVDNVCWTYRIGSVITRPNPTKPYGPGNFKWVKQNG